MAVAILARRTSIFQNKFICSYFIYFVKIQLFPILRCCNTCEEVKEAYRQKKWAFPNLETIDQCKSENYSDKLKHTFKEGCQIYGYMEVNRVSKQNCH